MQVIQETLNGTEADFEVCVGVKSGNTDKITDKRKMTLLVK